MENKKIMIILLAIIVLATALRAYNLDKKELGTDESWTVYHSKGFVSEDFHKYLLGENQPPLFHILGGFLTLISDNYTFLRSITIIISILGIIIFYKVSKEYFNVKWSLIATFLYSINPMYFIYSQHFRFYIVMMALAPLSFHYFYQFLQNEDKYRKKILIVNSILLLTHYYALFLIGSQILIYLWKSKYNLKKVLRSKYIQRISIIMTIVIIQIISTIYFKFLKESRELEGTWGPLVDTLGKVVYPLYKYATMLDISSTLILDVYSNFIIASIAILLALGGVIYFKKENNKKNNYLIATSIMTIIPPLIIGTITSFYSFRYVTFLLPIFIIYMTKGIEGTQNKKIQYILMIIMTIGWIYIIGIYWEMFTSPKWAIHFGV